jgi:hypothetical protein
MIQQQQINKEFLLNQFYRNQVKLENHNWYKKSTEILPLAIVTSNSKKTSYILMRWWCPLCTRPTCSVLSNFGYWTFQPFLVEFISNTIKDIRRRTIESSQHNPLNSRKKHVKIGWKMSIYLSNMQNFRPLSK